MRAFSFQATYLQHVRLKWKRGSKIFDGVQSTEYYPSIKVRNI